MTQNEVEKAARVLHFNEERLVKTTQTLLDAMRDRTHVFSNVEPIACHERLPSNIKPGSAEHASYDFFSTIIDKRIVSEVFYRKFRRLVEKDLKIINAGYLYELDRKQLTFSTKKDGSQILVAPGIGNVLQKELEVGYWKQISGELHSSGRKLHVVYEDDPRKILNGVTDIEVAFRKLDVGKGSVPAKKAINEMGPFRFKGFGKNKTAPLLLMRFTKNGFANKLSVYDIPSPFDTHQINLGIGRKIIEAPQELSLHYSVFARHAQTLYSVTFQKFNINPIDAHRAQWELGSNVCAKVGCYDIQVNGERACPFSEACTTFLDTTKYGNEGKIVGTKEEIFFQDIPRYGPQQ